MKVKLQDMYCVESLGIYSWMFYVYPHILKASKKLSTDQRESANFQILYLKSSKYGVPLARWTLRASKINASFEPLDFSMVNIKEANGDLIWWKALSDDSFALQDLIKTRPEFQGIVNQQKEKNRISQFLMRHIMFADLMNRSVRILTEMLYVIRVAMSPYFSKERCRDYVFFFSSQRPWLKEIARYVNKPNVHIVYLGTMDFNLKKFILKVSHIKSFVKLVLYYQMLLMHRLKKTPETQSVQRSSPSVSPKMAVEYYGHLNLNSPEMNSDLFFCQQSDIPRKDVLIYFHHPIFRATDEKWREIRDFGMSAIAIDPTATATPDIPFFRKSSNRINSPRKEFSLSTGQRYDPVVQKDLSRMMKEYDKKYAFWVDFITRQNIKMQVTWYKHDAKEYAMWNALQDTGGVGVIYQRSFEGAPDPWTVSAPDVVFGFSKLGALLGKDRESVIPYYVITGYLGDHRFPLVRTYANQVRSQLLSQGAKRIITFFDENSVDDPRWNVGHHATQENYAYVLTKVLEVPWLGLILKPKMVSSLRRRLGPEISNLLDQALATGRCFIFNQGHIVGVHPAATAASAADIAIHGHFFAATAGVESALCGTKTLMLDREGYSISPIYKLGIGKVIFKDWDSIWRACQDYWNSGETTPGFADWSSVLDEIDPFRDGHAAERMGTYLKWLLEGFKAKLPREVVLNDAAEQYAKRWGKDKIFSVNCGSKIQDYLSVK